MKKTTKGAVAAGAAAVLLAGGAGTFAAWNASTDGSDAGSVTAGSLSITEKDTDATWVWVDSGDEYNPESDKLVPGDSVKYTATYDVVLEGTNLKAELKPDLVGVDGDLKNYLDVSPADGATQNVEKSGDYTFTTQVTFRDLDDEEDGVYGAGESASLAGGTITLEQVLSSDDD